ncbi:MAG: hypothetical protein SPJ80_02365 [Bacilli bacterium]|nr:hypothetical protein [Bacilli bacterium]
MNKFKKKTRSKMIAASIAILSSAAVVSTGFAAWVISGGDEVVKTDGTITADEISNQVHTISDLTFVGDNTIYFGAPSNPKSTTSSWLSNNSDKKEKLTVILSFTVSVHESTLPSPKTLFEKIEVSEESQNSTTLNYSTYAETEPGKGYVKDFPTISLGDSYSETAGNTYGIYLVKDGALDVTSHTQKFKLTVIFGWGTTFGSDNPYYFYNGKVRDSANESDAMSKINDLHQMNAQLKITIKTN